MTPNLPPSVLGRCLSLGQRENIAIWHAQKVGVREIARRLGRSLSTISRELQRNASTRTWRLDYRASTAQWHAERRARRPKISKLDHSAITGVRLGPAGRGHPHLVHDRGQRLLRRIGAAGRDLCQETDPRARGSNNRHPRPPHHTPLRAHPRQCESDVARRPEHSYANRQRSGSWRYTPCTHATNMGSTGPASRSPSAFMGVTCWSLLGGVGNCTAE